MKQAKEDMKGRQYWRSLNEQADTEEFRKFVENEFPEGTLELSSQISRKKFLSLMGASMALAGLTGCRRPVEKIIPYSIAPEEIVPGVASYFATNMPFGTNAYGLIAENHEGRPTKLEGNPDHPGNLGSGNSFLQAEILNLYDPDRSQFVRFNGKRSSWEDFMVNWHTLYNENLINGGTGLAILSESFSSPTLARLKKQFTKTYPKAAWVTYDPVSDENIHTGLKTATGKSLQPVFALDKANIVLALDSDFMNTESNSLVNAKNFAKARRVRSETDHMNRLYAVESGFTLTGAMADHRLSMRPEQVAVFTAALSQELSAKGVPVEGSSSFADDVRHQFDHKWLSALADDLIRNMKECLVVAGSGQPAEVHALVYSINEALNNTSRTVTYYDTGDAELSSVSSLSRLVRDINNGKIKTLIMLGGNPVYNAPADLNFEAALWKLDNSTHVSNYVDETSANVTWHIPQAHFLEYWGDVRSFDGTASIIQPMIEPLFGSRSCAEVLSVILSGEETSGYDLIQETWQKILNNRTFDKSWRRVLHDGLLAQSAGSPVKTKLNSGDLKAALSRINLHPDSKGISLVLATSASVYDGRYTNNGWLQENPNPITKLTWDNAAIMGTATAANLNVVEGEIIEISTGRGSVKIPAFITPGFAEGCIVVDLGYGRTFGGRIARGSGFNAYPIRTSDHQHFISGCTVRKTGSTYKLVTTQDHHGLDVEKLAADEIEKRLPLLIREATINEYHKNPEFAKEVVEQPSLQSLWKEHTYDEGHQWGMAIDLNVCNGCNACTVACQSENNIPIVGKEEVGNGREMHWIRIDRYFAGEQENPEMVFQPVGCQHCEMAPCEQVCPVAATVHDAEGLNTMVYNRCIGTRYCANNCPYKVRRFNFFNYTKEIPEIAQMAMNPDVTVRFRGVMEKCTYCVQRINRGRIGAKNESREIKDGDVISACQQTCPTDAIVFGDINDPNSEISKVKKQNRDYAMLGELNFRPRTTYQAKLRNPNPELVQEKHTEKSEH